MGILTEKPWRGDFIAACVYINAGLVVILSLYLFVAPVAILIHDLNDPALSNGNVPSFAFRWHRKLSKEFEPWARERVASGQATELSTQNISGTEWPVFSSVFYLWSTESLQEAWQADPTLSPTMPKEYARGAIEAAAALVSDPSHAAWVKEHWGEDYLEHENLFYRMLLISGLTSYQKLLGDDSYQQLLSDQVESLADELDRSPYGLLDDYPGQCYPIDILPAIAAIRRADEVLGTDHSEFALRAVRAFEGARLDKKTGLPAYIADSETGIGYGPARGVGISFMLIWSPELWPQTANQWYINYDKYYWQQGRGAVGVREFPRDSSLPYAEWFLLDVDAGPVMAGYGTAASAFGIGAARVNGRLDQAYPLSAEALVASWPLPDGTLLIPRLLSNISDAPYVGETILLFTLTRTPIADRVVTSQSGIPFAVYFGIVLYLAVGMVFVGTSLVSIHHWQKHIKTKFPIPNRLFLILSIVCLLGLACAILIHPLLGLLVLISAQFFLRGNQQ